MKMITTMLLLLFSINANAQKRNSLVSCPKIHYRDENRKKRSFIDSTRICRTLFACSIFFEEDTITQTTEYGNIYKMFLINDCTYIWVWANVCPFIVLDTVPDCQIS
jgi:hypothetical protein